MLKVLHLVETPGQFIELQRTANLLRQSRDVEQFFLVHDCGDATDAIITRISEAGAECLNVTGGTSDGERRRALLDLLPRWLRALLRAVRDMARPAALMASYGRLLRGRNIDLVVVAEDNVGGRSRVLVAAATQQNRPVMLVPYTFPNADEPVATLGGFRAHQIRRPDQRLFAALRPRWERRAGSKRLLRLPVGQALVMELMGLAPDNPWMVNCGPATVAAESDAMSRQYRTLGCTDDKLAMTGSPVDMVLASRMDDRDRLRAELRRRYGLNEHLLLLCALPPDQLTTYVAACEFTTYAELINGWMSALQSVADRFAILVRPHPRTPEMALAPLRRAGIAISQDDTAELIPLCDLYVAALSATIRWAITCGRPVVNYDVYGYRYTDYADVPGVLTVERAADFRSLIAELARDPERLTALARMQTVVAPQWGCLDGKSGTRILALVDRLVSAARPTQSPDVA
jgi:hypothetical protein